VQLVAVADMNLDPRQRRALVPSSAHWQRPGKGTWRLLLEHDSDILVWQPGIRWTWEYRVGNAVLLHAKHTRDTDELAKDESVVEVRKFLRALGSRLPGGT
jgi:hypothetical protein